MEQKFSVLLNIYAKDHPAWIKQALDSVLTNTVRPPEIVIMVDGPTSKEIQTILDEASKNKTVRIFSHNIAYGRAEALSFAIPKCSYDLIALHSADSISLPDRFEKQLAYFAAHLEMAVLGGQIQEIDGESLQPVAVRTVPQTDREIKTYLRMRSPFNHVTVMYKKAAVLAAGNYQPFHLMEDYYLWARMAAKGYQMGNLPDIVLNARVDSAMYGQCGGWKYFKSNYAMSKKLRELHLIPRTTHAFNACIRFCVQVLMPNNVRSYFYRKALR